MLNKLLCTVMVANSISLAAGYPTSNSQLNSELEIQSTQLDRLNILNNNKSWSFNFITQPSYLANPGSVVTANAANFPAVIGNGMAMAFITLAPCGILPAHIHPRAANYVVGIKGSTKTFFFEENGANVITNTLTPGVMTIFPQAALHTMYNEGCTESILISALSHPDPGTLTFANSLFELPVDIVGNAFGADMSTIKTKVPGLASNAIAGTRDCLARCGK
ncbi:Spherulin-1A [Arthrobotrys entomopaga]|nr:Spherulin-1A [Arthrobotrys entomopaga]